MSFAVIKTGGKQYKVKAGEIIKVENAEDGSVEYQAVGTLNGNFESRPIPGVVPDENDQIILNNQLYTRTGPNEPYTLSVDARDTEKPEFISLEKTMYVSRETLMLQKMYPQNGDVCWRNSGDPHCLTKVFRPNKSKFFFSLHSCINVPRFNGM